MCIDALISKFVVMVMTMIEDETWLAANTFEYLIMVLSLSDKLNGGK